MISLKDVVCGRQIALDDAAVLHRVEWQGDWYFLCSSKCVERFRVAPAAYVGQVAVPAFPGHRQEHWREAPERASAHHATAGPRVNEAGS